MGCRTLTGMQEENGDFSVMYDSTTGETFGPVFWNMDAAEKFIQYCQPQDPRSLISQKGLFTARYNEFCRLFLCQDCNGLRNDECGWCSGFAEEYPLKDGKHVCAPLPLSECDQKPNSRCNHADPEQCCGGGVDGKGKGQPCGCVSCHGEIRGCEKEPEPAASERYVCSACIARRIRIREQEKQRNERRRQRAAK